MLRKPRAGRKLLVASIGVATMTYVGTNCGGASSLPSGSDDGAAGSSSSGGITGPVGNLMPAPIDARADGRDATGGDGPFIGPVGNLMGIPTDAADSSDRTIADSPEDAADATTQDSPQDSTTDMGTTVFDVIDDFPIANLIVPPLDGGE
jgi:hypothetical protein